MVNKQIATYLNNHLAGSVTVINLLAHLEEAYADTDIVPFLTTLRADITADRTELETVMDQLQISKNPLRQTMAWFAEKASQLQLKWDDAGDGSLHLLEALEIVAVGIQGKYALAHSLMVAAEEIVALQIMDFERLAERSEEQQQRLEAVRVVVAKAALTTNSTA